MFYFFQKMSPEELVARIEAEFDEFDRLEADQLKIILDEHKHVAEEVLGEKEEEEISHFLTKTGEKLNQLRSSLQGINLEGQLSSEEYKTIIGLAKDAYIAPMLTLHLISSYDLENPDIKSKYDGGIPLPKTEPVDSLHKKVKAHFALGELYFVLGIKTSTEIKDRSAFAEFKKVIDEGLDIYAGFLDSSKKGPEEFLKVIRLARDIATSYVRLAALYSKEGKDEEAEDNRAQAHGHFDKMFRLNNSNGIPCDMDTVFPSKEAFARYLTDIHDIGALCVFQYEKDGEIECIKRSDYPEQICEHRKRSLCNYTPIENVAGAAHWARNEEL